MRGACGRSEWDEKASHCPLDTGDEDGSQTGARASKSRGLPLTLREQCKVVGKVSGREDAHKFRLGT